jgi:hypothetical protein
LGAHSGLRHWDGGPRAARAHRIVRHSIRQLFFIFLNSKAFHTCGARCFTSRARKIVVRATLLVKTPYDDLRHFRASPRAYCDHSDPWIRGAQSGSPTPPPARARVPSDSCGMRCPAANKATTASRSALGSQARSLGRTSSTPGSRVRIPGASYVPRMDSRGTKPARATP